jgi:hypothetical protein
VTYRITNNGTSVIDTHLLVVARGLSRGIRMDNASGITRTGDPYRRVFLPEGVLLPGQAIEQTLVFTRNAQATPPRYGLVLLSGQGKP